MVNTYTMSLLKIITYITDSLFPPRGTERRVRKLTPERVRDLYNIRHKYNCIALSDYQNTDIQAIITENKFYENKKAAQLLGTLITHWHETTSGDHIYIPIPLSKKREHERGYNQVHEILLQSNAKDSMRTDLCTRTKHTPPQVGLSREKRLKNVSGAFVCNVQKIRELRNVTVVVVDDVCTTGATLGAARASLAPHLHPSCKIICLALAH